MLVEYASEAVQGPSNILGYIFLENMLENTTVVQYANLSLIQLNPS